MIQQDLFGDNAIDQKNPLTNRRVGFIGTFKNRAALIKKVKEFGASDKSKDGLTRDTQILVLGNDVKLEDLNRLKCYEHDGWKPLKITEADLQEIFRGHYSGYKTPEIATKQVSIDMSYYKWTPPVLSEEDGEDDTGVRCSSPLVYGDNNPIYGLEVFVPQRTNADMGVIRQLIGNFGGYANPEYYDETNVIMLGEETLRLLEQGIKDDVIKQIEAQYNKSSAKMFNIQFTSEPDFISWVKKRMEKFPDESTMKLLEKLNDNSPITSETQNVIDGKETKLTNELIAECTAYDYKVALEENRPKSWLKSVSAFANGLGGSLFFGVNNDGIVKGLDDVQRVCEVISNKVRDYMDPLPEVEMLPHKEGKLRILQLKVNAGHYTPYYYVGDNQRIAYVRVGDESLPATAEQMLRLVLKGTNKTYDSLHTDYKASDNSFVILANTFKMRTNQEWDKKYLVSFGLVTSDGYLTNAGALFADDSPLSQSQLYCTRWDGKEKGDAINDAEFTGNVLLLLRESMNFVKSNTKRGWEKLPDGRKNKPEYAERAVLETMVNHFIHRDYTVMGAEVHLDIYDDRLVVTSPGGMYNGMLIQNLDIADVSSERRNPILANVMAQLDYMEKRGSGLTRICNETKALEGYKDELKPVFKSTPTQFQTIIYASVDETGVGDNVGDMSEVKLSERQVKVLIIIKDSPTISGRKMSEMLSVSQRTIERDLAALAKYGILQHKGNDNDGEWQLTELGLRVFKENCLNS